MNSHKNYFIFKMLIILILVFVLCLLLVQFKHLKNADSFKNSIAENLIQTSDNNLNPSDNSQELADEVYEDTSQEIISTENTIDENIYESNTSTIDDEDHLQNDSIITVQENTSELFSQYYNRADEILSTMTLEEKVAQMFLSRYPGTSQAIQETTLASPGGYILFDKDFSNKTKDSINSELLNLQNSSKIPLLLAVDEEGGSVVRVSNNTNFRSSKFQSPQVLFNAGGLEAILKDSTEKTSLLKSLGLNMNLAPVVDVPTDSSSFIYSRSYGQDAENTAVYAYELIAQMNKDGIVSSMKHFPGYGDNVDTHTGIAIDSRDYSIFENSDFLPFISGIKSQCPTIMVNHNIINCIDNTKPASLSENVHKILRETLGFSGLIITDDLAMSAIKNYASNGESAVQAVIAGNDLIISSNFSVQKQEVLKAVMEGRISESTINTAVRRIIACKLAYGIID